MGASNIASLKVVLVDPHLVAVVRTGATLVYGQLLERPDDQPQPEAA
jgi:hypothetical protein